MSVEQCLQARCQVHDLLCSGSHSLPSMRILRLKRPFVTFHLVLSECNDFLSPFVYQPFTSHLNKLLVMLNTGLIKTEYSW